MRADIRGIEESGIGASTEFFFQAFYTRRFHAKRPLFLEYQLTKSLETTEYTEWQWPFSGVHAKQKQYPRVQYKSNIQ
jgi:hypothetical protein